MQIISSAAILTTNPAFKIEFANTICEELLKAKNQELLGKEMQQLFENNTAFDNLKNEIINSTNDDITIPEQNLKTIDNSNANLPVKIIIKKIKNKTNKLLGIIFIFKDISKINNYARLLEEKNNNIQTLQQELETEKQSAEEKIKQSVSKLETEHNRLLSSINSLNLAFLMTDKYKNIIFANKTAATSFPVLKNQQTTIQEFIKTELINYNLNEQIDKCLKEKILIKLSDVQINLKFANIFISPIILDEKLAPNPIGAVVIIKDKTEQHNLEISKEDSFAITSHELRTPLTAIYGYISLIKQIYFSDIQDVQLKNLINNIGILSKKLSLSVNNFLDSSRLEQNRIQLKKEQCNLSAIISEAVKVMECLALEKNLYIKFDPPPLPVIVQGDNARLTQIITILISNAIKFTQLGGIYITLTQKPDLAKVSVQDTGYGIKQENITLLFGKFRQAGNNNLTNQEGLGLGLYVAKLLIEKMNGQIQLEKTEVNKGSTFSFTIPI